MYSVNIIHPPLPHLPRSYRNRSVDKLARLSQFSVVWEIMQFFLSDNSGGCRCVMCHVTRHVGGGGSFVEVFGLWERYQSSSVNTEQSSSVASINHSTRGSRTFHPPPPPLNILPLPPISSLLKHRDENFMTFSRGLDWIGLSKV